MHPPSQHDIYRDVFSRLPFFSFSSWLASPSLQTRPAAASQDRIMFVCPRRAAPMPCHRIHACPPRTRGSLSEASLLGRPTRSAVLLPDDGRRGQMSDERPSDRPFSSPAPVTNGRPRAYTRRRRPIPPPFRPREKSRPIWFGDGTPRHVASTTLSSCPRPGSQCLPH